MESSFEHEIAALRDDRVSGASELLARAVAILREAARGDRETQVRVARAVCQAKPAMAPIWNAAAALLGGGAEGLERFAARARRAPETLTRVCTSLLLDRPPGSRAGTIRIATLSFSGSVLACLRALATVRPIRVACSEGRPMFEGRRFAATLAESGVVTDFYTDASLTSSLEGCEAVLVGADAIAGDWFVNKTGTRALMAVAAALGIPSYVVASREKFAPPWLASRLVLEEADPHEVWPTPPPGVLVKNPYFEKVPLEAAAAVISDIGVLPPDQMDAACAASAPQDEVAFLLSS